jgi:hypothetical protein
MEVFKKGQGVTIGLEGQQIDAVIIIASENGKSLAAVFDGFIGGYVQMMPILYDDSTGYFKDLVKGRELKITANDKQERETE